jgi:hypothetical protein
MNTAPRTADTIERARKYLAKLPGAVSGSNGHAATFKAACALVQGFDLGESDALHLLREYNSACDPPWSEHDLLHKIASAAKSSSNKPRGYLVNANRNPHQQYQPPPPRPAPPETGKPNLTGFGPGTTEQIRTLARHRYHREALEWASIRGVLVFGDWHGNPCYGVTDSSNRILELRRVDGTPFAPMGDLKERKAHAVKGSQKSWPVGILEARNAPAIALVEGIPDFMAAHYLALWEQSPSYRHRDTSCVPVAMLSGSPAIHVDALPHFKGKRVRIYPHADKTGLFGAHKWSKQLAQAGAAAVSFFDFSPYRQADGSPVNDLEDFLERINPATLRQHPELFRILP